MGNSPVLLLTVAGRKSGTPHTVPVAYVHRDGAFYLAGAGGSKGADPAWIRNLRKASSATIEVGSRSIPVSVEVLGDAAGDEAWRKIIVATLPIFGRYEQRVGRRAAVARLCPRGDDTV